MTPDEVRQIAAIERERRKREKELLLLFLLLFGLACRRASQAIRHGIDPVTAATAVILGDDRLELLGLATPLATLLAIAHIDGMRRAGLSGGNYPGPRSDVPADLVRAYAPAARSAAGSMGQTLAGRISRAIGDSRAAGLGIAGTVAALRRAMTDGGYLAGNPYLLATVAEAQIVTAHGAGMYEGWMGPGGEKVLGFIHRSVLDKVTTKICRERDGFTRPRDDPYWLTSWPSLHFSCRSVILPVFHDRKWSTVYPTTPPSPGFGRISLPLGVRP